MGHSCPVDVLVGWKERPAHFVKHLTSYQQITFDKGFQVSPHFTYFPSTLMRHLHNFLFNNWINWLPYPSSLKIRKVYTSNGSLKVFFLFSSTTFSQKYIVSFICLSLMLLWFLHSKNVAHQLSYILIFTVLILLSKGRCNMFINYLHYFTSDVVPVLTWIR